MIRAIGITLIGAVLGAPVWAMDCTGRIAALHQGGPIDPFARGSWRETTMKVEEDGTETLSSQSEWESPSRVRTLTLTSHIIAIGSETWSSDAAGETWTRSGRTLPEDIEAFHKAHNDALMRNLSEVSCPGVIEFEGREVMQYTYRTKTDKNEYGSWFGGLYTAFIDTETNRLVRMEISENIASWDTKPSKWKYVTVLEYDPEIKIDPPE